MKKLYLLLLVSCLAYSAPAPQLIPPAGQKTEAGSPLKEAPAEKEKVQAPQVEAKAPQAQGTISDVLKKIPTAANSQDLAHIAKDFSETEGSKTISLGDLPIIGSAFGELGELSKPFSKSVQITNLSLQHKGDVLILSGDATVVGVPSKVEIAIGIGQALSTYMVLKNTKVRLRGASR